MLVPGWLLARLWERRLSRVLAAALEGRAGTFVDVGAHVGEFLLKLRRIRPEVPYLGFEPNPEAYRVLARRAARLSGTRVRQVALGEREEVARLRFRRRGADPEASLVEGFRDASFYRSSIEVPVSPDVRLHHVMTVNLSAGTIDHVVNGVGGPADTTRIGQPVFVVDSP